VSNTSSIAIFVRDTGRGDRSEIWEESDFVVTSDGDIDDPVGDL
jgi:hypothetical protein